MPNRIRLNPSTQKKCTAENKGFIFWRDSSEFVRTRPMLEKYREKWCSQFSCFLRFPEMNCLGFLQNLTFCGAVRRGPPKNKHKTSPPESRSWLQGKECCMHYASNHPYFPLVLLFGWHPPYAHHPPLVPYAFLGLPSKVPPSLCERERERKKEQSTWRSSSPAFESTPREPIYVQYRVWKYCLPSFVASSWKSQLAQPKRVSFKDGGGGCSRSRRWPLWRSGGWDLSFISQTWIHQDPAVSLLDTVKNFTCHLLNLFTNSCPTAQPSSLSSFATSSHVRWEAIWERCWLHVFSLGASVGIKDNRGQLRFCGPAQLEWRSSVLATWSCLGDTLGSAKIYTLRGTQQTHAIKPGDCDQRLDN